MRNRYGVPVKLWRQWSPFQQRVFNCMFRSMKDQRLFIHPETHPLHPVEWDTIRWNAAYLAAEASAGRRLEIVE